MDSSKLLGNFLRARREATTPGQVGLSQSGSRRTPGLRREEVAMLTGVSTDYYIRIEQGRERHPSDQVLAALARALHLDADATNYLYELAHPRARPPGQINRLDQVSPGVVRLMESWDQTPAFLISRRLDVLAANRLAEALYGALSYLDNCMRMVFLSPEAPDFYADWEKVAHSKTAQLRSALGADAEDPALRRLIEELSAHSPEFRRMWARHDVRSRSDEVKRFHHPEVGELTLNYEVFTVSGAPGQQLIVLAAEPGSSSDHALAELGRRVAVPGVGFRPQPLLKPSLDIARSASVRMVQARSSSGPVRRTA
jgi:transcriptional regulator with XRE-family HTH domain